MIAASCDTGRFAGSFSVGSHSVLFSNLSFVCPVQPNVFILSLLQLVQGYMNLKLGVDRVYAEMDEDYEDCVPDMSLEAAIDVIQRNERGRQGKQRARLVKHVREEEKRQRYPFVSV